MESAPKNNESGVSGNEVKENSPKIDTAYAYIQTKERIKTYDGISDKVMALYTDKEELMNLAHPDNMFATEEETLVPLHVYESEEELPEEIRKRIQTDTSDSHVPVETSIKEEGVVYAVLPNTDSTEGRGFNFIWALVTDPVLAHKIANGNGPGGGDAEVIRIPLNKFPLDLKTGVTIRRDVKGELTDELYA